MRRACVFVDGENFRHSLKHLFPSGRYSFGKGDYLPEADWHAFFTSLADGFDCELLRAYWYVVEHVDCRPYKIPHEWDAKERVLARWYFDRINACSTEPDRHKLLKTLERELEEARVAIERRARGWREIQAGIESHNDQLEFRRSGSIPYELATKQFGVEKGVDTYEVKVPNMTYDLWIGMGTEVGVEQVASSARNHPGGRARPRRHQSWRHAVDPI